MIVRTVFTVIVFSLGTAGCSNFTGPGQNLNDARDKWNAAKLTHYEFDYIQQCGECPVGLGVLYHVRVSAGGITMTDAQNGSNPPDYVVRPTIPILFSMIETTLRNHPARFSALYNSSLGYPESLSVDIEKNAIDDEWGLNVINLRAF